MTSDISRLETSRSLQPVTSIANNPIERVSLSNATHLLTMANGPAEFPQRGLASFRIFRVFGLLSVSCEIKSPPPRPHHREAKQSTAAPEGHAHHGSIV